MTHNIIMTLQIPTEAIATLVIFDYINIEGLDDSMQEHLVLIY